MSQYSTHRVAYEVQRKWQRVWWNWGYTGVDTRVLEIEYSSQSVPQLHFQIFQNLCDLTDLICDPKVPTPWFQQRDPDPKLRNRAPPLADPKRERRFHVTKIPGPFSIIPWYSMAFHGIPCFIMFHSIPRMLEYAEVCRCCDRSAWSDGSTRFFKSMHDVSTGAQGHNIEAPGDLESYLEAIWSYELK